MTHTQSNPDSSETTYIERKVKQHKEITKQVPKTPWSHIPTRSVDRIPHTPINNLHDNLSVGYKHCCGIFTMLHKCKVHYSRVCSTLVPSVACQTTEVTLQLYYRSPTLSFLQAKPCADHHLSIGYEPWLWLARKKEVPGKKRNLQRKTSEMVKIPELAKDGQNWKIYHCRDCPVPGCIFRIGSTDTRLLP